MFDINRIETRVSFRFVLQLINFETNENFDFFSLEKFESNLSSEMELNFLCVVRVNQINQLGFPR